MFVFYALLISMLMSTLGYCCLKHYQMCGYNLKKFFGGIFEIRFRVDDKNTLILTKRMLRFLALYFLLIFAIFLIIFYYIQSFWLILLDILATTILLPVIIAVAHLILFPIEELIKKYYLKKAKKKLEKFKGIKIAIVGSFGKTSVKNILYQILKDKFKTIVTPKNFNTPMGISKTILTELKEDTQIAIFEMGARHEGDIKQLVKFVDPDIGILTSIGQQHLETFGDLETIKRTKSEIVKYIKKEGNIVFNGSCENLKNVFRECKLKKYLACSNDGVSYLENLQVSNKGSSFDLIVFGQNRNVNTRLLGEINAENITLAATVAFLLKVDMDYIKERIEMLEPAKNRLELLDKGIFTIIDDSYNANPIGCDQALNVLSLFKGEKIVVTSGMVELGNVQYEKNFLLGKKIGEVADVVLIMNEVNKKAILEGLRISKFDLSCVFYASTRDEQKEILKQIVKKDCVVLFQNDLPDNYR